MAKSPKRKLKVFEAQLGFYETVVAAPSQAAALRAWGIHQNIFADGQARLSTNEAAVKAATAHPETVLKRPVGSKGAFKLTPDKLAAAPSPSLPPNRTKVASPKSNPASSRPKPDRSSLTRAEAALVEIEEAHRRDEAEFRQRQAGLDAEKAAAKTAYGDQKAAANAALAEARKAYRGAGGRAWD